MTFNISSFILFSSKLKMFFFFNNSLTQRFYLHLTLFLLFCSCSIFNYWESCRHFNNFFEWCEFSNPKKKMIYLKSTKFSCLNEVTSASRNDCAFLLNIYCTKESQEFKNTYKSFFNVKMYFSLYILCSRCHFLFYVKLSKIFSVCIVYCSHAIFIIIIVITTIQLYVF